MNRMKTGELGSSRGAVSQPKHKPEKRPHFLRRIFGSKDAASDKPAYAARIKECPPHQKDMLLI